VFKRSFWMLMVGLALALASSALAAPPTRTPVPSGPLEFRGGLVCSFPVLLETVENSQVIKTFADGRQIVTGHYVTRVTNLDTRQAVIRRNSGPIFVTPNADGTVTVKGAGQTLFFFFPGDLGVGEPGALLFMTGLVVETLPADFSAILSFSHKGGTTENLCTTLAP